VRSVIVAELWPIRPAVVRTSVPSVNNVAANLWRVSRKRVDEIFALRARRA
jgi:hypothetical protein